MEVGLINIEPKIFNTALMQISYHHKLQGDTVKWASPFEYDNYDKLYCSSLFDFTDKTQVPDRAIKGGTGFDLTTILPFDCKYDYSIYPDCITSFVWFSRGCDRNCPFCVVRQKEGRFHLVKRKELNPKGRYITIMDNDFFANPEWREVINWIGDLKIDMQGFDVRKITQEKCKALANLKLWKSKRFKTAWDNPKDKKRILPKLEMLANIVRPNRVTVYVLIGYKSTQSEDMDRIVELNKLGFSPFVMQYKKGDMYQDMFTRWINVKQMFKTKTWKQFQLKRIGRVVFDCGKDITVKELDKGQRSLFDETNAIKLQ